MKVDIKIFCVYDSKNEAFGVPFMRQYTGDAIREWSDMASGHVDKNSPICRYAADFTLFELGVFNQREGTFNLYEVKRSLGTALEHVRKEGE